MMTDQPELVKKMDENLVDFNRKLTGNYDPVQHKKMYEVNEVLVVDEVADEAWDEDSVIVLIAQSIIQVVADNVKQVGKRSAGTGKLRYKTIKMFNVFSNFRQHLEVSGEHSDEGDSNAVVFTDG